ncbi:MAG: hypothetical protein JRN20_12530 [Nitrososphaerota archaeon]|nr:hypothetical protein [Nitrososphaerota archaeon]
MRCLPQQEWQIVAVGISFKFLLAFLSVKAENITPIPINAMNLVFEIWGFIIYQFPTNNIFQMGCHAKRISFTIAI